MEENKKNQGNKPQNSTKVAPVDPDVAKYQELIGADPHKSLNTDAFAKAMILQGKTQVATNTALANRIIAALSDKQDKAIEVSEDGMRVTKACYDKTKANIDKGFKETKEAIEELDRPLAVWAWIVPILVALFMGIVIFGVAMKMDLLMCTVLGLSAGLVTFVITFIINQYGGHKKKGSENEYE